MAQSTITEFYTAKKRFKDITKELTTLGKDETSHIQKPGIIERKTYNVKNRGKVGTRVKPSVNKSKQSSKINEINIPEVQDVLKKSDISTTTKRNLSSPDELSPSKKKLLLTAKETKKITAATLKKSAEQKVGKKLQMVAEKNKFELHETCVADYKEGTPKKDLSGGNGEQINETDVKGYKGGTPNKDISPRKNLASLINESRSKILFSGKLDELKKSLEKFSQVSSVTNEFQSNSFKITSVLKPSEAAAPSDFKKKPAYKKYSYLTATESSLVLPYKYKLLCETFRCLDTVVSMLNNRKEKITFEKVQSGVQKMNNRNFTKTHLAQIASVFPDAYSFHYEKCDRIIIKKGDAPNFQLVIIPNLSETEESSSATQNTVSLPKKSSCFLHMTPQHLSERKNVFSYNLLNLTRKYHQEFLTRLNFPAVSDDSILRWHPKFQVDSVPDIKPAELPEVPEIKMCTAKDVLNKIRGKVRGRVEKALQSVAEESKSSMSSSENIKLEESITKQPLNKKQSSALKGICTDLLEKIRARESAKLLETITRSPEETRKLEMLQNVPKIVHILWHYFIAERKAAVPIDVAVDKIIHSCSSLTTPDKVKEYLQLITETFPGWLSFIKIPKGEYITMDKKRDINVMLRSLKC